MSKGKSRMAVAALVVLGLGVSPLLGGCASKAETGAGVGALAGGLAGSLLGKSKNREQNALIGAAVGGLAGYAIGNEMDKTDQNKINHTLETSKSYQQTSWTNPDTKREYQVTPYPAYERDGVTCRDAEVDAIIDGRHEKMTTNACRQSDGQWVMTKKQ